MPVNIWLVAGIWPETGTRSDAAALVTAPTTPVLGVIVPALMPEDVLGGATFGGAHDVVAPALDVAAAALDVATPGFDVVASALDVVALVLEVGPVISAGHASATLALSVSEAPDPAVAAAHARAFAGAVLAAGAFATAAFVAGIELLVMLLPRSSPLAPQEQLLP
jgi:hypothetical protein